MTEVIDEKLADMIRVTASERSLDLDRIRYEEMTKPIDIQKPRGTNNKSMFKPLDIQKPLVTDDNDMFRAIHVCELTLNGYPRHIFKVKKDTHVEDWTVTDGNGSCDMVGGYNIRNALQKRTVWVYGVANKGYIGGIALYWDNDEATADDRADKDRDEGALLVPPFPVEYEVPE